MNTNLKSKKTSKKKKTLLGLSGGGGSFIAGLLLKNQGADLHGVHFTFKPPRDFPYSFESHCYSLHREEAVKRFAKILGITYEVVNLFDIFENEVMDNLVHELLQNRAANPCLKCHYSVKLKNLFKYADEKNFDFIATGHYVKITQEADTGHARLLRSSESDRDQSYYFFELQQLELNRLVTPLGSLQSSMVTRLAREMGVEDFIEKNAKEICFVQTPKCFEFIEKRSPKDLYSGGAVRTLDGVVIGEHQGFYRHYVGQLMPGLKTKNNEKYYVLGFDPKDHQIIVGFEDRLLGKKLMASKNNWIRPTNQLKTLECLAQVHPNHKPALCHVEFFENQVLRVEFLEPQKAIQVGHAIVFFEGEELLGGAYIDKVVRPEWMDGIYKEGHPDGKGHS